MEAQEQAKKEKEKEKEAAEATPDYAAALMSPAVAKVSGYLFFCFIYFFRLYWRLELTD